MMECPFCGAANLPGSLRCRTCGNDLVDRDIDFSIGGSGASFTTEDNLPKRGRQRTLIPDNGGAFHPRPRIDAGDLAPAMAGAAPGADMAAPEAAAPGGDTAAPEAYALVDCPAAVERGQAFWVQVGLGPSPQDGATEEGLVLPPWQAEPFTVTALLHLTNARLWGKKQSLRLELKVSQETPYPTRQVQIYVPKREIDHLGAVHVSYFLESEPIGAATRVFQVGPIQPGAVPVAMTPARDRTTLTRPTALVAPDLTIQIRLGERVGDLVWSYFPKDQKLDISDVGVESRVGEDPLTFLRTLMDDLQTAAEDELDLKMRGFGCEIAERLPAGFTALLDKVSPPDRPPSILLVTEEPFVPWELAWIESPSGRDAAYFGARAAIGRWCVSNVPVPEPAGQKRRKKLVEPPPPPGSVTVSRLAVLWGEYDRRPLKHAKAEAERLRTRYGAEEVKSRRSDILAYLKRPPDHGLIHYAGHGRYSPDGKSGGLELIDGKNLSAMTVRGARLTGAPLVFLNACQVGAGFKLLGGMGGMVDAFIGAGAAAVISPLWSVDDTVANQLATEFYDLALPLDDNVEGVSPAFVLQSQRARFDGTGSPSVMAYQFFGHPNLTVTRSS